MTPEREHRNVFLTRTQVADGAGSETCIWEPLSVFQQVPQPQRVPRGEDSALYMTGVRGLVTGLLFQRLVSDTFSSLNVSAGCGQHGS